MKISPTKTRIILLFGLLGIICLCALFRYSKSPAEFTGLSTRGGENLSIAIECPYFSQQDPRWQSDMLGESDCSIGNYGCTLSSAAMALNSFGIQCTPKTLNQALSADSGYTSGGLLIWESLRFFAGDSFKMVIKDSASHSYLDKQLQQGIPIIAKVLWHGEVWHWVLITGKEGEQYLIADPLVPDNPHLPATSYPDGFFSIRHLVKR